MHLERHEWDIHIVRAFRPSKFASNSSALETQKHHALGPKPAARRRHDQLDPILPVLEQRERGIHAARRRATGLRLMAGILRIARSGRSGRRAAKFAA